MSYMVADGADFDPLEKYVIEEIAAAATRKTSFETRAFSIVALNIGVLTVFFALQGQLKTTVADFSTCLKILFFVAVGFSASSIACAAASAFPFQYPFLSEKSFKQLYNQAKSGRSDLHRQKLVEFRLFQLRSATDRNTVKGWLIFAAFTALGISAVLVVATLAFAIF